MISGIERTSTVESPLHAEVSAWVAEVSLEMRSLPMLKNACKKPGYNWFEGEKVEEGNVDDTDDDNGDDFDKMEHLVNNVLGGNKDEDKDDNDAVADDDINSEDDVSDEVDSDNEEEEFFPVIEEVEVILI